MTVNPKNRKRSIHAVVPDEAHDAWQEFAIEHGPSVSALIDAIGRRLANGEMVLHMDQIVKQARQISAENRRRRRTA